MRCTRWCRFDLEIDDLDDKEDHDVGGDDKEGSMDECGLSCGVGKDICRS